MYRKTGVDEAMKMNWKRAILISIPFFTLTLFWQAYDYIVPLMLSRHYRLGTTVYSMLMSVDNIIALIFLPLFGILSDRISSRLGRRSPLILIGTVGGVAGLVFMNIADTHAVSGENTFALFLIALLVAVFFMSLHRSPSAALVADCFIRPQRTLANAVLNLVGGLGAVLFGVVGHLLITQRGGEPVFTRCVTFVILAILLTSAAYFLLVRENRFVEEVRQKNTELGLLDEKTDDRVGKTALSPAEKKSLLLILFAVFFVYMGYNGFHTHYTNYLVSHLRKPASWTGPYLLEAGLGMTMMIPSAFVSAKIGRKKSCRIGMAACVVGFFGLSSVSPENPDMIYLWFFIAAVGFPLFGINLGPMVLELSRDRDSGRYMGYYYVAVTTAQIVTPTLASLFINHYGYRIIGVYSACCTAMSFCAFLFVRHGDVKTSFKQAFQDAAAIEE